MELKHKIDRKYFSELLQTKQMTQGQLAQKLSENEKTLSRWINNGYPSTKIMDLRRALGIKPDEFRSLLNTPKFKIFFRNKFLNKVPKETEDKALSWTRVLFNSTQMNSQSTIAGVDLSQDTDPKETANKIKNLLKLPKGCFLDEYVANLNEHGIEVVSLPFALFGLQNDKEQAFSVFDGKNRYAIFINSDCNKPAMVWNLCHEICHLFRPNAEQGRDEETFCQDVAKNILYPVDYFNLNAQKIKEALTSNESAINLLEEIKDQLIGSSFAIALRLGELGFTKGKQKSYLISVGRNQDQELKKQSDLYFKDYIDKSNFDNLMKFWDDIDPTNTILRLFYKIKQSVTHDRMTPRKFSELLDIDLSLATHLSEQWRNRYLAIEG